MLNWYFDGENSEFFVADIFTSLDGKLLFYCIWICHWSAVLFFLSTVIYTQSTSFGSRGIT